MKQVISLVFIFFSTSSIACKLTLPVVNLSGSLTMIMDEIGLLDDPKLRAVSSYYINESKARSHTVDLLMGGIFLSPKIMKKYKKAFFLIDESKELRQQFQKLNLKNEILKTRGLTPIQAIKASFNLLEKVSQGCTKRMKALLKAVDKQVADIKKVKWDKERIFFFLGSMKAGFPQMLMVNDGFVKYLRDKFGLKTYPSTVAYSGWSQKKIEQIHDENTIYMGLVADSDLHESSYDFKHLRKNEWDANARYLLVPGLGQLDFVHRLSLVIKGKKL